MTRIEHPRIIQGGMGAGVSWWKLARAVSRKGQMGVVSGTALDLILARRLQDGDIGGHVRRAMDHFPFPKMADRIWKKYYREGGRKPGEPYAAVPMHSKTPIRDLVELCIVGNFAEIYLSREGHDGPVGINYLEKIQMPHLPSIYGAMLAGVAYILMGAGIPLKIPSIIDALSKHKSVEYHIHVEGAVKCEDGLMTFNPREFMERDIDPLPVPYFLPIIASNALGSMMIQKADGRIDGFIIEGPTAGGHNAPPRGRLQLSPAGEPVYGERDTVDIAKIRSLGLPFWIAGGTATPEKLREVIAMGGTGIQVGTVFALCEESGLRKDCREQLLEKARKGTASVFTDPRASPTGFPFKVARLEGTLSEDDIYKARSRVCDLGYLRTVYRKEDGSIGYRCTAEAVDVYTAKGGVTDDTIGRKCLCNALMSNIDHPQLRPGGYVEKPLITTGNDLVDIAKVMVHGKNSFTAEDVINYLLS